MEVKVKSVYKHFKGDYYIVEDLAMHTETEETCVIYRGLYTGGRLFVRPYDLFIKPVDKEKYPDVEQEYVFELQDIDSKRLKSMQEVQKNEARVVKKSNLI